MQSPGNCPRSLAVSQNSARDRVIVSLSTDLNPSVLPLSTALGQTPADQECPATLDPETVEVARDCRLPETQEDGKVVQVAVEWKLVAKERGQVLSYSRRYGEESWRCEYDRSGPTPDDPTLPIVNVRPEPPRGRLNAGERVEYREISREVYGQDAVAQYSIGLSELDVGEVRHYDLTSIKADTKVTVQRKLNPCFLIVVNGRKPDPSRCDTVTFDRFEERKVMRRSLDVRWDYAQDKNQRIEGNFVGKLRFDGQLEQKFVPASAEKKYFFGFLESPNEVVFRSEAPSSGLADLGSVLKSVSVSKGILYLNVADRDPSIYKFKLQVERERVGSIPLSVFSGPLDEAKLQVGRASGDTVLSYPLRANTDELAIGRVHFFVVEIRPKKLTDSGFDRDFTLLVSPLPLAPVETKKFRIKIAD